MIICLGANVLFRLWKQKPHFHFHHHETGVHHLHAHTHLQETVEHKKSGHRHQHKDLGLGKAVLVGMMHGTAGSAGLLVLAATADSVLNSIGYVLAFGLGSIAGMAALSFVASYPLGFLERCAEWINRTALALVGCAAIFIGLRIFTENWIAL
jgi:ABC-type nickel/cobalt efflux system permease component RcnA